MKITLTNKANQPLDLDEFSLSFRFEYGGPIRYYDDGMGPLWIMRDTRGIVGIVRAQSMGDAYSIIGDEFRQVVPDDEIHEAYGAYDKLRQRMIDKGNDDNYQLCRFSSDWASFYFDVSTKDANHTGAWNEWELIEGYEYQSNSTGSGIVSIDLNGESLDPLIPELIDRLQLEVCINLCKQPREVSNANH